MKNVFTKCLCATALTFVSFASVAAELLAVWDEDFSELSQNGVTIDPMGNSISDDKSSITITQDVGVNVNFPSDFGPGMTVIFKYSDLSLGQTQVLATSCCAGDVNRTGVYLDESNQAKGIWNTAKWDNPGANLTESSGMLAFCYGNTAGTSLYYLSAGNERKEIYNYGSLKSSSDSKLTGCTIGGERFKTGATLLPAASGMTITGIAVYKGLFTEDEMNGFSWTKVTLDGTEASWSGLSAPVSGIVTMNFAESATLEIDSAVSLEALILNGAENAVLKLSTSDGGSFVASKKVVVNSGVLQQGSGSVLGATPVLAVAKSGTFDMNGHSISDSTAVYIAGQGSGNWPWALTSSSGNSGYICGGLYLMDDATIGGTNDIHIGKYGATAYYLYLQGFTLAKIGTGAVRGNNMNTPGEGVIDMQGGILSVGTFNNLNSSGGETKLVLNEGSEFVNTSDRTISVNELEWNGGLAIIADSQKAIGVKTKLTGFGTTKKLVFGDGATAILSGNLTVQTAFALAGNASFAKDSETEGEVIVTAAGLMVPEGKTITVGEGVVFDLGSCRTASVVLQGGKLRVKLLPNDYAFELNVSGLDSVDDIEVYSDAENLKVSKKYENGVLTIENINERVLTGGASADQIIAYGEITVAAGEVLKTTGYLSMTLTSDGVVDVLDGCVEVTKKSDKSVKGTIYIREGAEWVNKSSDAVAYDNNTATIVHVYGKLNMADSRWTFGGNSVLHLYGGSEMCGRGDGNNGVNGIFDFYRGGDILQVHLSDKEDASNIAKITGYLRVRTEICNAKIDEGALLEMSGGIGNGNTLVRTGAGGFSKVFLDGTTLDLGKYVNTQARFVSRKGTNTIKIVGDNAFSFCENDSKADPVVKVERGSTLTLALRDFSGWNGDVTEHGWIVNNGTLNLVANGGSRFFRDHIVIGDGASTVVVQDSADRAQILYGGADSAELAQIQLPEGSATISTNGNAEVKAFYLGTDGNGGYGGKGAGISVGRNAVLTLESAVKGGDKLVKWGAGTVIFAGRMDGFSGALVLNGGVIEMLPDCDYRGTVTTEVEKMQVVRTEMANGNIRYKVSPKYFYIRIR